MERNRTRHRSTGFMSREQMARKLEGFEHWRRYRYKRAKRGETFCAYANRFTGMCTPSWISEPPMIIIRGIDATYWGWEVAHAQKETWTPTNLPRGNDKPIGWVCNVLENQRAFSRRGGGRHASASQVLTRAMKDRVQGQALFVIIKLGTCFGSPEHASC